MSSYEHFRDHYANRLDDELIHIALTTDMVPDAKRAMEDELLKRGISDLAPHREEYLREFDMREQNRQKQIRSRAKVNVAIKFSLYLIALCLLLWAGLNFLFSESEDKGAVSVAFAVGGLGLACYASISYRIQKFWIEKVLFRKPVN